MDVHTPHRSHERRCRSWTNPDPCGTYVSKEQEGEIKSDEWHETIVVGIMKDGSVKGRESGGMEMAS